jgi:glycopeptide antibiotics resistance protein
LPLFIPFGFLGLIFPKYRNFKPLAISFLSFLTIIESLQYFTKLGFFDVDDFLLNTFGLWIGFKMFKISSSKF